MASGARLGRYDPKSVIATWGVIPLLSGRAPSQFITMERRTRTWALPVGVDGEAARVRTNDFTGIVNITLRNGSLTNTALTVALQIDEITGLAPTPFFMTDFSGLTVWSSPLAFL